MSQIPQLVLAGSVSFDRIMRFPGTFEQAIQPDKLHMLSISLLLDELRITRGGVAANIAYNLALLGEKPILYATVGEDARLYVKDLAKMGINVDNVHYSHLNTATFTVMTDKHDCQVGGFYSGAMGDAESLTFKPWAKQRQNALMVISPHHPEQMARQVAEAQKYKLRMVYDIGQQVNNVVAEELQQGLEAAEVLIVNDYEMGLLEKKTGWSKRKITEKVPVVVVTLGEHGCEMFTQSGSRDACVIRSQSVPAVAVASVVDPTGAGDAFRAGFLYGYIRQWPLHQAAQLGATVAAYAVEAFGTQEHRFTKNELSARYLTAYNLPIPW